MFNWQRHGEQFEVIGRFENDIQQDKGFKVWLVLGDEERYNASLCGRNGHLL